jgi:hypothetical protein
MLHCIGMYTYKVETAAQTKGTCWNSVWIDLHYLILPRARVGVFQHVLS